VKITAIITHFRNGDFLKEAVDSVLAQTRPADEILVIDDATPAAEATELTRLPAEVRLIRLPVNGGAGAARQFAAVQARGDWLAYLDADDLWLPTKLARQQAFLEAHPGVLALHTGTVMFTPDGSERTYLHKPECQRGERALLQAEIIPSSLMLHRQALLDVGGWSADRGIIEDWDLEIRLTNAGTPLWFLAEPLIRFRRANHGNLSSRPLLNVKRQLRTIWRHRALMNRVHGKGVWRAVASRVIGDELYKAGGATRVAIWAMSRTLRVGAPKIPPH
jgi:teichuronic acid biosynthesis glycosyltransferase TuaG